MPRRLLGCRVHKQFRRGRKKGVRALFMPSRKRRSGSIITKGAKAASSSAAWPEAKEGRVLYALLTRVLQEKTGGRKGKSGAQKHIFPSDAALFLSISLFCGEWREKVAENFHSTFLGIGGASKCLWWKRKTLLFLWHQRRKKLFFVSFLTLEVIATGQKLSKNISGPKKVGLFAKIRHFPDISQKKGFF